LPAASGSNNNNPGKRNIIGGIFFAHNIH